MKSSILSGLELFPKKNPLLKNESSTPTPTPKTTTLPPQNASSAMASAVATSNSTKSNQLSFPDSMLPLRKDEQFRRFIDDQLNQKKAVATINSGARGNDSLRRTDIPKTIPSKLDIFNALVASMAAGKKERFTSDHSNNAANRPIPIASKPAVTNPQPHSDNPRQSIPKEYSVLADILDQLPDDFDLTKWDDKTASQQHNALTKSGLSDQDQMKLLNASTSIETLALIQDIQTNRIGYGLTQTKADSISEGLLKIANARIGVKNRGLPFTSDLQRNLFLKQLDKEEQKLLESVDGQSYDDDDMLTDDKITNQPLQYNVPLKNGRIKRVENSSKVALLAKDFLKAFIGVQYIVPSGLLLLPAKVLGDLIDEGTISFGMQDNASILYVGGANGSMGLAMDSTGDIGALRTEGKYLGIPSAAITVFASASNADRLRDLEGHSIVYGGSIGEILTVGADVAFFTDKSGKKKFAVNLELGLGVSQLPIEGHIGGSEAQSFVDPTGEDETWKIYNIYNAWENCVKKVLEW
jgi:hypothetical protein